MEGQPGALCTEEDLIDPPTPPLASKAILLQSKCGISVVLPERRELEELLKTQQLQILRKDNGEQGLLKNSLFLHKSEKEAGL